MTMKIDEFGTDVMLFYWGGGARGGCRGNLGGGGVELAASKEKRLYRAQGH